MNQNRVIKAFVISMILATTSIAIAPTIVAQPLFHSIKGTLYIDDSVAGPGVDIKFEVSALDFSVIYQTIEQDQNGYNFVPELFDDETFGGATVEFKVEYEGSFVSPVDNVSIVLDKDDESVAEYILDLHVDATSGDDDDDDDDDDNGGSGGSGGSGGYTPSNQPPVADASESQTSGYVDESIDFDGSKSDDPDGTIDLYEWDWDNDGTYDYNSTSSTTTHTFNVAGTYSVALRVTDNEGATDKDTIEVIISKANLPPTKPTIEGTSEGTKDTEYTYNFQSTDPDNDTIQYIVNWGDGEVTETEFLPNGTASTQIHSWMSAGKYTLTVRAFDNETVSATNQTTVLIDVHLVDDIGYLIDDDADGTYDSFHNDTSGQETDVEKQDDGTYLLDDDGDGEWDYVYDIETGTLTEYSEPTPDNTALIVLAIIVILFLIILGYLVKRSNDKKKAQKKAAEKKSQPKKKTTSKKSKK